MNDALPAESEKQVHMQVGIEAGPMGVVPSVGGMAEDVCLAEKSVCQL
jgi:hypothetical protein